VNKNVILATCLVLALPAYAQTGTQSPPASTQQNAGAATKQFVEKAAVSDMFEIQSSQLAAEKANDDAVKAFARKMVEDHTKTSNEMKAMVQKLQGVQLPTQLDNEHRQKLEQLRSAAGGQFQQQYRSQQIEAHQAAVRLFEDYGRNGDNDEMKSWAQKTLPNLQQHLQHAQGLPQQAQDVSQAPAAGQQPDRQAQGRGAAGQQSARPIANPSPNHIMASDLRGTRVYGSNDENVGSIDDIVLDRNGRIVAVVVGVGGFLGIGEKNVAIPFEAIEIRQQGNASGSSGRSSTGTTGTGTDRNASGQTSGTMDPDRVVLRGMSKQDLEGAPKFDARGQR
jgi:putative membrane protein